MKRSRVAAGLLLGLGVLLPVQATAGFLAGADSPLLQQVVLGVWALKIMLLVHAGLGVFASHRALSEQSGDSNGEASRASMGGLAVAGVLLVVGGALRLRHLGAGLWFDEIQTLVDYVRLPLGRIVTTFDNQNQHMLYSILAHLATSLFGDGAWALRFPAAAMGTASLWAVYRLGTRVAGEREALLGMALLTFSYHHVWFSQNARGYSGLLLCTVLGTDAFLRLLDSPRAGWGTALAYGGWMALAIYTHVTAVFVVVAHAIVLAGLALVQGRGALPQLKRAGAGVLLAGTLSLQLYALVLPQFVQTLTTPTMEGTATAWKNPFWLLSETVGGLARGLPGGWLTLAVGAAVAAAGAWSYLRQSRVVFALFALPAVVTLGAVMVLSHNLWPRFFFFSAGFAVLMAVRGVFVLSRAVLPARGPLLATAGLALVALASGFTVPRAWGPKQDYEGASAFVDARHGPDDAVVTLDMTSYAYARYFAKSWPAVDDVDSLNRIERAHPRTWVLYTFPIRVAAIEPAVWSRLTSAYDTAAVFPGSVAGGAIVVLVSKSPLPPT